MVHGLTFIAAASKSDSARRWEAEERARRIRLDRYHRLTLLEHENLTSAERAVLVSIARQLEDPNLSESSKDCPECGRPFLLVNVKNLEIDCCRFCHGIWFDPGELQMLSHLTKEIPSDHLKHRQSRYRCPVCQTEMVEYVFINPRNLLVDRCPNGHGVYLEDRELERVFEIATIDVQNDIQGD